MHLAVVLDCINLDLLSTFWLAALDFEQIHRDGIYVALRAKDGSRPTPVLQRVSEPKSAKNRMHLDVYTDRPPRTCGISKLLVHRRSARNGMTKVLAGLYLLIPKATSSAC